MTHRDREPYGAVREIGVMIMCFIILSDFFTL